MQIVVARADSTVPCRIAPALDAGGHCTSRVQTGTDAFKTLLFTNADALILDGSLPDVSEYDLCSGLRTIDYSGIIMLITDMADLGSRLRAFESGADSYLVNPAEPVEILARLEAFDRLFSVRKSAPGPEFCRARTRTGSAPLRQIQRGVLLL